MADNQAQSGSMDITASSPTHQPHQGYESEVKVFSRKSCVKKEDDLAEYSKLSLEYYNSNHKSGFELVDLLYINCVTSWKDFCPGYLHMSFTARSKNSPSLVKLFFAEVYSHETEESFIPYVKTCTPVDPGTPFCSTGCGVCSTDGVIYHPLGQYRMGGFSRYSSPPYTLLDPAEESAKKLLHEKYIFKTSIQDLCPEEDEEFRKIIDCYARSSISHYETRTRCSIRLLKVVAAVRFSDCSAQCFKDAREWIHMLFLAVSGGDQVEVLFAEVSIDYSWVTTCVSLSRADHYGLESDVKTGCRLCREYCSMSHPESGYIAGIDGGNFVDALDATRSWRLKVDLEEK